MKLFIFYGSFLAFPFLVLLLYILTTKPEALSGFVATSAIYGLIALSLLFIYTRFIEPQRIILMMAAVILYWPLPNTEITLKLNILIGYPHMLMAIRDDFKSSHFQTTMSLFR